MLKMRQGGSAKETLRGERLHPNFSNLKFY